MSAVAIDVDAALVRALLGDQHPDLAALPLTPLACGWDNSVWRLGDVLTVRLPRREAAAGLIEREQRWLPRLAPRLPLRVPAPLRIGRPALGYPWSWSVCPWFAGDDAVTLAPDDPLDAAATLGRFVAALHQPAPAEAPPNPFRGIPLRDRDARLRECLRVVPDVDAPRILASWEALLGTAPWDRAPVWIHGDLHPANLLVADGRIAAVLDFGDVTGGDPATDLAVAWMLFPETARAAFRAAAGDIDTDTWRRARGWAIALALAYLAGSPDERRLASVARRTLAAALDDALA